MTRPDVAALAAALLHPMRPVLEDLGIEENEGEWCEGMAGLVLAALDAAGWRITSAPEPSGVPVAVVQPQTEDVATADDPASAQAVPDFQPPDSWVRAHWPGTCRRIEAAAVRAALEGLRAEMVELRGYVLTIDRDIVTVDIDSGYRQVAVPPAQVTVTYTEGEPGSIDREHVLAAIDKRLEKLP